MISKAASSPDDQNVDKINVYKRLQTDVCWVWTYQREFLFIAFSCEVGKIKLCVPTCVCFDFIDHFGENGLFVTREQIGTGLLLLFEH